MNAGLENGRFQDVELVYRDDVRACFGALPPDDPRLALVRSADVLVFGSGIYPAQCIEDDLVWLEAAGTRMVVLSSKHFGYNLSAFARLPADARDGVVARVPQHVLDRNALLSATIPPGNYVDIIAMISDDPQTVPVFDGAGRFISPDGAHLTRSGARFVGERLFEHPALSGL